jgi:hypothetical protein
MSLDHQVKLCSKHYQKWKSLALSASSLEESKKSLEKAFFWLELQTAFITLFTIEQTKGNDPKVLKKLIRARTNLSKKIANYAKEILDEVNI